METLKPFKHYAPFPYHNVPSYVRISEATGHCQGVPDLFRETMKGNTNAKNRPVRMFTSRDEDDWQDFPSRAAAGRYIECKSSSDLSRLIFSHEWSERYQCSMWYIDEMEE